MHAVVGGHELVVGVERHLRDAGVGAAGLLGVDAHLGGQHDERRLGRVADDVAVVADRRVAVETEPERQAGPVRRRRPGDRRDRAGLAVALALDREPIAVAVHGRDHHLVHRERAGLVGVDRARRAEGLDVGQVLHDRLGGGELAGAHREQRRDERRHPGRDRRDRHRGAEQQEIDRPANREASRRPR